MSEPALSVVIPTFGSHEVLGRVLDGYAAQDAGPGAFEVIVVVDRDDPDPAAAAEAAAGRPFPVRQLTGAVPGASANRNAGWRAARAPIVLFTDNDTIPVPRLVSEHLRWHERHPGEAVGVLGHVRWAPELRVTPFMRWLDRGIQFDYGGIEGVDAGPGRLYSANASLKRSFIEAVGGFDEEHLPYGYEDTEWAYRASRRGFRLLYARKAVVDHLRPMTLEFWQKRARRLGAAERRLVELHPELEPSLLWMFRNALHEPPASGRGVKLYPYVPRWVPWLGPRVHASTDLAFKQALAPAFVEGWEAADAAGLRPSPPDVSEHIPSPE
jgi:GT2 family glycosyltransferase